MEMHNDRPSITFNPQLLVVMCKIVVQIIT